MRNCRNYNQNLFFFCLRYIFTIFYIGSFQVPPKKNHPHLNCQFPLKIPTLPKSLLYERFEKWLSPLPHPSPRGVRGGVNYVSLHLIQEWPPQLFSCESGEFFQNSFFKRKPVNCFCKKKFERDSLPSGTIFIIKRKTQKKKERKRKRKTKKREN